MPNPFMSDYPTPAPQSNLGLFDQGSAAPGGEFHSQGGDLFGAGGQADLFGDDRAAPKASEAASSSALATGKSSATPPPRPPPPAQATANGTPRSMSPAVGGASPGKPAAATGPSKSAFDDLNDSIRMALGRSPSRPPPLAQQAAPVQQGQQPLQQGFAMFDVGGGSTGIGGQPMMGAAGSADGYGVPNPQAQVPVGYGSPARQPMSGDESVSCVSRHALLACFGVMLFDVLLRAQFQSLFLSVLFMRVVLEL